MLEPRLIDMDLRRLYSMRLSEVPDGLCRFNRVGDSYSIYYKSNDIIAFLIEFDDSGFNCGVEFYRHIDEPGVYYEPFLGDNLGGISFAEFINDVTDLDDQEFVDWVMFNLDILSMDRS